MLKIQGVTTWYQSIGLEYLETVGRLLGSWVQNHYILTKLGHTCVSDIHSTMWHCIYVTVGLHRVVRPDWWSYRFVVYLLLMISLLFLCREMPPRHENRQGRIGNLKMGAGQNQLAREIVAALAAANLLQPPPRENADNRALIAMREFSRTNPPQFDGESNDPLVADHWLAHMRKIFNALKITEDDLRVSIVACQLTGEANEWWESILGVRRDARRAARAESQENEPDEENLTWAKFEELFENQYFPESYREQLRINLRG
ncbi:uncharacterized protein LOC131322904 [Rhododendron vialii]|uniref:uncharacterized protein LOC131322904 n=1 Tax=Rhododendron vialii TaxID=182163 RepID=UPI00265E747E|nr:uncharacterized protein LOC131322904 [Rhododendron vialii]